MWFLRAGRDLGHRMSDTLIAQVRSLQPSQEAWKLIKGQNWNSGFPSACMFFLLPYTHNYTWVYIIDVFMCSPAHILCLYLSMMANVNTGEFMERLRNQGHLPTYLCYLPGNIGIPLSIT